MLGVPLGFRLLVERADRRRRLAREGRTLPRQLHDLVHRRRHILEQLARLHQSTIDVVEPRRVGVPRRVQIVELQPELVGEHAQMHVPGVDELAAVLTHLPAREVPGTPAAATDAIAGFEHLGRQTGLVQSVGGGHPGQTRAHDHDTGCVGAGSNRLTARRWVVTGGEVAARQQQAADRDAAHLQEVPPGQSLRHVDGLVERQGSVMPDVPSNGRHLPQGSIHRMTPSTGHWFASIGREVREGSPYGSTALEGTYVNEPGERLQGALAGSSGGTGSGTRRWRGLRTPRRRAWHGHGTRRHLRGWTSRGEARRNHWLRGSRAYR